MKRLLVICALLAMAACAQQPPPPPVASNPPPPPAPPPPPPPTTFTVFFDYNSARIGPAGREIIQLAANGYKSGAPSGVQVTGFTDPSGGARYNQRLSLQRANAVAAALERDGVPKSAIATSGQGETTAGPNPGQDRRVEISLGGPSAPSS
jgi:outer membrane protein OmpA-like peptidoglycan-associated protein